MTITPTNINGSVEVVAGVKFAVLNGGFVVVLTELFCYMRRCNYLLILLTLALMLRRKVMRLPRLFAFLTVTRQSLNSLLSFLFNISKT